MSNGKAGIRKRNNEELELSVCFEQLRGPRQHVSIGLDPCEAAQAMERLDVIAHIQKDP